MILTCPDCRTRYTVDDAALGGTAGRDVRCAKCGRVWHYRPEETPTREPVAETAAAADGTAEKAAAIATPVSPPSASPPPARTPPARSPLVDAMLRAEPRFETPPPSLGPPPPPRSLIDSALDRDPGKIGRSPAPRRRRFRVAGLVLAGLMLALVLVAILARDTVMSTWPSTASLYRSVRLADAVGAGLQVTVSPARTPDSLVVNGRITNTARTAREVPRLRVALRDGNNAEVDSQVIDPPRNLLAPGATTAFSTVFKHPSIAATGVAVTFASR
jgi:predicted Zn finger-like uncharacterized protein